jgi:hypothetical protein
MEDENSSLCYLHCLHCSSVNELELDHQKEEHVFINSTTKKMIDSLREKIIISISEINKFELLLNDKT